MSPRTRKKSADAEVAEAEQTEETEAETPKKRGRPKNSARKSKIVAAEPDLVDTEPVATADAETTEAKPAPKSRKQQTTSAPDDDSADTSAASDDTGDDDTDTDTDTEASGRDDGEARSNRSRGRQGNRSSRKQTLNYRDLQSKIQPELHLLAKEVGLSDYRQMSKDDLAVAILERVSESEGLKLVRGYLEISSDGYGFLQESLLQNNTRSVIVSAGLIKQFKLRTGDYILGKARRPRENERYGTLIRVEAVNGTDPFQASKRPRFDDLTPTFPETRIRLETTRNEVASRVIDLLAPIGRGQRGLIVAPPKAGKTTLLKKVANAVITNEPDIKVIVLLVDERPEEVTDFRESVTGVEVIASTFDEPPANHIRVAEFVHERARRIVEDGNHVMILLDSITRLARANNLVTPPTGRTLSGGLDSSALHWPKRFLGAARNIRGGGSLSILATALIETGSRMDDVIFEEFKGTGNMELHLSRRLEEKRIFPAIDILKSGTRREDLLLGESALAKMWLLRKVMSDMDTAEAMDMLLSRLSRTDSNEDFLATLGQG
ncbi:MAG: transcription termination factor Rho [Trueperaceae bacterium]|nr:transcription termination factor Rho [Trueperaceae bacterium]